MNNEEKKRELLLRIKKISDLYKRGTNPQKIEIFDKTSFLVDDLIEFGYPRDLVESLVMFGKDFLTIPSMIDNTFYRLPFPEMYDVFEVDKKKEH